MGWEPWTGCYPASGVLWPVHRYWVRLICLHILTIGHVTVNGESGREAHVCDYDWVLDIRAQCAAAGITFRFKRTGSLFRHGGVEQRINPYKQGSIAKELGITISDGKKLF